MVEALQSNKLVSKVKLTDNFFSENIESFVEDSLNKNTNLGELKLGGNRFSHACLAKLRKITKRNLKMIEEHEPNKLKAEIYRLRYEHSKLEKAKTQLKEQKQEIEDVKKLKIDLQDHLKEYKVQQDNKRATMQRQIQDQKQQITEKERLIRQKQLQMKASEDEYEQKMAEL